jgi:hypothetical protein
MAFTDYRHSKLSVVTLDNAAGSPINISRSITTFSLKQTLENKKTTSISATAHTYLNGFSDGKCSMKGSWSRDIHTQMGAIYAALNAGTIASVTLVYGPEGADTGDIKQTCELILDDWSGAESSVENPLEWSAEWTVTGGVTESTY